MLAQQSRIDARLTDCVVDEVFPRTKAWPSLCDFLCATCVSQPLHKRTGDMAGQFTAVIV